MARSTILVKRVYEPPAPADGKRFLVDRLWPRGVKKSALHLDGWLKEAAPSTALRRWFHRDPTQWREFQVRYRAELDGNPAAWRPLLAAARRGRVTLLFASRDLKRNHALVLQAYLRRRR